MKSLYQNEQSFNTVLMLTDNVTDNFDIYKCLKRKENTTDNSMSQINRDVTPLLEPSLTHTEALKYQLFKAS